VRPRHIFDGGNNAFQILLGSYETTPYWAVAFRPLATEHCCFGVSRGAHLGYSGCYWAGSQLTQGDWNMG